MPESHDYLNLTPSPRLLEVIGEVDLELWRCVAELADNSFDELTHATEADPHYDGRVYVALPKTNTAAGEAQVVVSDTGRGMTRDQLETALTAGSSGNQRYGSLGLFGMGFNIATARLGHLTEVWTTRSGDPDWIVAKIDLRAMQKAKTFQAPLRSEAKTEGEHGTRVVISQMRPDILDQLRRPTAVRKLAVQLGDVYSYLLRSPSEGEYSGDAVAGGSGIKLFINGKAVDPRLPCMWDPDRHVSRSGADISAVIKIDVALKDAWACMSCGHWHDLNVDQCTECGSTEIEVRPRRIHGWVGIQRYLDKSDFGIDILRQGRKILLRDKSLFNWTAEESLTPEVEYPVELGSTQGGRIIGEIHLDHVPVNYRKSDFTRETRDWKTMVGVVRGDSPLGEKIAKRRGFPENISPIGRLYKGYRRNVPGLNYLVPGDGKGPLMEKSRKWAEKFRAGDPEYLTDTIWYTTALYHDYAALGIRPPETGEAGADANEIPDSVKRELMNLGLGDLFGTDTDEDEDAAADAGTEQPQPGDNRPKATDSTGAADEPHVETEAERFERYRSHSRVVLGMDADLTLPNGIAAHLTVLATTAVVLHDRGKATYVVTRLADSVLEVYVDESNELITQFGWDPGDLSLVAAAEALRTLYRLEEWTTAALVEYVARQFDDRKVTEAALRGRADDALDRIRDALAPVTAGRPDVLWSCLSSEEKRQTEQAAQVTSADIDWTTALDSGEYGSFVTAPAVARMVRECPQFLLDGQVFRRSWKTWESEEVKARTAAKLSQLLVDLGEFQGDSSRNRPQELLRIKLTIDLLQQEIVEP